MNAKQPPPQWLINSVIVLVVLVWVANFIARASIHNYNPPEGVDALMLAVIGFLMAGRQAASNAESKDDDGSDSGNSSNPDPTDRGNP